MRAALRGVATPLTSAVAGGVAVVAWQQGLWGLLTGAMLVVPWLGIVRWQAISGPRRTAAGEADGSGREATTYPLLLDAVPTPMVAVEGSAIRALNRAARRLFATDDRVGSPPAGLDDAALSHVAIDGRRWRVDRVTLDDGARMIAALIDIEREERAAEARASAEMIHVLGHELLNGLAPIASLAESGLAAVARRDPDPALLHEVLGTLARRAEGLQRFTEAYRALARLPQPRRGSVSIDELVDDLARLFAGSWPQVSLVIAVDRPLVAAIDGDQLSQALWALLQNAAEAGAAQVRLSAVIDGAMLSIAVSDDGPGIDPADAGRIFRPFHTSKAEGTGVGLSLARQIAHGHGGTLTLEPGAGARFRMRLPM